ncbi:hypothetical protein ACO0OE_001552 [Hanseniaspora uvarum]
MAGEKENKIIPPVIKTEMVTTSDVDSYQTDKNRKHTYPSKLLSAFEDGESNEHSLSSSNKHSKTESRTSAFNSIDKGKTNRSKKLYPFLFPDFEYVYKLFQSDGSLKERTNEITVTGFELYLVETWALEREKTCLLPAYTGNPNNLINCCQMFLPLEPSLWPNSNLRSYYKIMSKIGFLKYIVGKGYIFVVDIHDLNLNHYQITNLILIPNGTTIRDVWNNFVLNINLRELQCSGRTSSMFQIPSSSTMEKFFQLYKIPKKSLGSQVYDYYVDNDYDSNIPASSNYINKQINKYFMKLYTDVELLVYMIQISLWFFDLFDVQDIDGLLCKNTQRALGKWQKTFGAVYFPHLNQTLKTSITYNRINSNLITALISLVMVIFFKLKKLNCFENLNIECNKKDPFINPFLLFHGISTFQDKLDVNSDNFKADKTGGIKNAAGYTKFLNFYVIDKLFELTDETDSADLNQFKKIIKTTVKDFSVSKKGIKKALNKIGSKNSVDNLASTAELTNSIEEFVEKIQLYKDDFKNSETLLATISINSSGSKDSDFNQETFIETINVHEVEFENMISKDESVFQRIKDFEKSHAGLDFYNSIRFKFPTNITSIIGYMWVELSSPIVGYFSKSKNKEYDYGFYNRFVWVDYNSSFDKQYRELYNTESKRLVEDIDTLKDNGSKETDKHKGKPDDNLYLRQKLKKSLNETSKLKTSEIVERFRIHQFYSSFTDNSENKLDEISKELYDYYNYKYVEHNEISNNILMSPKENNISGRTADGNNTELSLRENSNVSGIDDSEQKDTHEGELFMLHLPVDDKLIDKQSREHIKIYEKVQEEIVKTNLDVFLRKEIYNPSFEEELVRRNSVADVSFLTKKENSKPVFIRSQSFSLVEDTVNEFRNNLTSRSIGKHINVALKEFDSAEARITSRKKHEVLEKINKMNQESVAECNKNFELMKTNLFQKLQSNTTQLEKQKKQLDSTVSKYSYDSRLLERKIENCTETQEAYEVKLDKMKARLLQDAKSKGLQYLVQLRQDKIISIEDIKESYNGNNNYLINKELANVLAKLGDSTDPREIVEVMRKSRLHIYCNGTNQSVIISNILRLFLRVYHMIMLMFNSSGNREEVID